MLTEHSFQSYLSLISTMTQEDMNEAMEYVAGTAKSFGIGLDEVTTALALFADAGIKGSMAGTTLKRIIINLLAPTEEIKKGLDELGIKVYDEQGKFRGLTTVLGELIPTLGGLTEEERNHYIELIAGARAISGFNKLVTAGTERFNELKTSIENADGTIEEMANEVGGTAASQFTIFNNKLNDIKMTIGEQLIPVLLKLINVFETKIIPFFKALFKGDWKTVEKMWNEAWNNFTKAAGEWWETSFKPWLAKLPERIWDVLCGLADIITKINNFFGDKFSEWADTLWNIDTFSIGKDIADKLLNGLHDVIFGTEETESLGETIGESMENGYLAAIGHFWISLIKLVASIGWTLLRFVSGFFYGIGEAMVYALWDGICGLRDWIIDKIKGFGGWIIDGIKDALGIKSPSKVMIDVGKNIVYGLQIGLNSIKPTIPTPEMPRVTYPEYSGYGGMGMGERNIIFSGDIHIHGVQNVDEFMDELERRFAVVR